MTVEALLFQILVCRMGGEKAIAFKRNHAHSIAVIVPAYNNFTLLLKSLLL